jgi:TonB family protein
VDAGPTVEITPLAIEPRGTTYRVRLTHGATLLAEPAVVVRPGGLAIVGTRDGTAAPYLFVVLEDTARLAARPVREPRKIHHLSPQYPPEAKEARVGGVVIMKCRLDVEGRVAQAEVIRGIPGEPGARLNEAALEAVRQWRYEPVVDELGSPTETEITVTVNFRLAPPEARPPK